MEEALPPPYSPPGVLLRMTGERHGTLLRLEVPEGVVVWSHTDGAAVKRCRGGVGETEALPDSPRGASSTRSRPVTMSPEPWWNRHTLMPPR